MSTEPAKEVDAWEIWNEPNADQFKLGYMDGTPKNYFEMLKIANQIIKTNSHADVVAAGLSPYDFSYGSWTKWLIDFSTLSPQNYFDYQGVHLYNDTGINSYIINYTKSIMNVQDVWVTEIGQPSAPTSEGFSRQGQSSYIDSNFQMLEELTKNPTFWYQLKDENKTSMGKEDNFGLFDWYDNPKESSLVFSKFASG